MPDYDTTYLKKKTYNNSCLHHLTHENKTRLGLLEAVEP